MHDRMLKGLRALGEEKLIKKHVVVSLDSAPRDLDGIEIIPWDKFLVKLWSREWL